MGLREVGFFKVAPGIVESAELDGDTGADAEEGGESALVECEGPFVDEDVLGAFESRGVCAGRLESDFDDIWDG